MLPHATEQIAKTTLYCSTKPNQLFFEKKVEMIGQPCRGGSQRLSAKRSVALAREQPIEYCAATTHPPGEAAE